MSVKDLGFHTLRWDWRDPTRQAGRTLCTRCNEEFYELNMAKCSQCNSLLCSVRGCAWLHSPEECLAFELQSLYKEVDN